MRFAARGSENGYRSLPRWPLPVIDIRMLRDSGDVPRHGVDRSSGYAVAKGCAYGANRVSVTPYLLPRAFPEVHELGDCRPRDFSDLCGVEPNSASGGIDQARGKDRLLIALFVSKNAGWDGLPISLSVGLEPVVTVDQVQASVERDEPDGRRVMVRILLEAVKQIIHCVVQTIDSPHSIDDSRNEHWVSGLEIWTGLNHRKRNLFDVDVLPQPKDGPQVSATSDAHRLPPAFGSGGG